MDDLYTNLENYDDVTAIVELRKENENLKRKLEEYAINMESLQKDFDKVTSEFKRLETNYSSLLKTARAEIERKTLAIFNLNKEKDKLVLSTKKNGNRNMFKFSRNNKPFDRNKLQNKNKLNSDSESCKGSKEEEKEVQDNPKPNMKGLSEERKELSHSKSEDTITSSNTDNSYKLVNRETEGLVPFTERNSDSKENIALKQHDVKYTQACSIKNRRKSMPAARMPDPKFSSDEEDHNSTSKGGNRYDFLGRKARDHQNLIRDHIDKDSNKFPDTPNYTRPYGNHEPMRDTFKNRRNYDNDQFRARDKYEMWKSRRRFSPNRSWKPPRDYHDDHYHRPEYGRQRRLQTPPFEPNWTHRSWERNTHRESNSHTISNFSRNEHDRQTYHQTDNHLANKHRVVCETVEEPSSKRPRLSSYSAQNEENNHWVHERDTRQTQNVCDMLQEQSTCQSPDFMHPDLLPEHIHVTKEIKSTAATPLDDPRVTSKKYVIKSGDGDTTLSTVRGRNIDIIPLDKSVWRIPTPFYTPTALLQPPCQTNEDELAKTVYMDIDNPVSNFSLESGEIDSVSEFEIDIRKETNDNLDKNKCTPIVGSKSPDKITKVENSHENKTIKQFRIPKLKHCSTKQEPQIETIPRKSLRLKDSLTNDEDKARRDLAKYCDRRKSHFDTRPDHDSTVSKCINGNKANDYSKHSKKNVLTSREIVEVDLQLSDENSDNAVLPPITTKVNEPIASSVEPSNGNIVKKINDQEKKETPEDSIKLKIDDKVNKLLSHGNIETELIDKDISLNKRKCKDKKKPSKRKSLSTKEDADAAPAKEKKRSKKEKDKPKLTKNKFSDLFGDSSSLITPEDLGMNQQPVEVKLQSTNTCVPFLEDAQDALDITISKVVSNDADLVSNKALESSTHKDMQRKVPDIDENPILTGKVIHELPKVIPTEEADVVKTVIISSGVQPQCAIENIEPIKETLPIETNGHVGNVRSSVLVKNPDLLLKALATSTPYKPYEVGAVEPAATVNATVPTSDLSDTNTVDSQPDTDVPDVRIFVRRRRKAVRRT